MRHKRQNDRRSHRGRRKKVDYRGKAMEELLFRSTRRKQHVLCQNHCVCHGDYTQRVPINNADRL